MAQNVIFYQFSISGMTHGIEPDNVSVSIINPPPRIFFSDLAKKRGGQLSHLSISDDLDDLQQSGSEC